MKRKARKPSVNKQWVKKRCFSWPRLTQLKGFLNPKLDLFSRVRLAKSPQRIFGGGRPIRKHLDDWMDLLSITFKAAPQILHSQVEPISSSSRGDTDMWAMMLPGVDLNPDTSQERSQINKQSTGKSFHLCSNANHSNHPVWIQQLTLQPCMTIYLAAARFAVASSIPCFCHN